MTWWVRVYIVAFVGLIGCLITSVVGASEVRDSTQHLTIAAVARGLAPIVTFVTGVAMAIPVYHKTIRGPGWLLFLGFFMVVAGWYGAIQGPALFGALALGLIQGFGTGIVMPRPEPLPKRLRS